MTDHDPEFDVDAVTPPTPAEIGRRLTAYGHACLIAMGVGTLLPWAVHIRRANPDSSLQMAGEWDLWHLGGANIDGVSIERIAAVMVALALVAGLGVVAAAELRRGWCKAGGASALAALVAEYALARQLDNGFEWGTHYGAAYGLFVTMAATMGYAVGLFAAAWALPGRRRSLLAWLGRW